MSVTKGRLRESHNPQARAAAEEHADDGENALRGAEPSGGEERVGTFRAAVWPAVEAAFLLNARDHGGNQDEEAEARRGRCSTPGWTRWRRRAASMRRTERAATPYARGT